MHIYIYYACLLSLPQEMQLSQKRSVARSNVVINTLAPAKNVLGIDGLS